MNQLATKNTDFQVRYPDRGRRVNRNMSQNRRFPALALWHDELRAGLRTRTTFDILYGAACAEAEAREFYGMRIPKLGDRFIARSREIIRQAGPDFAKKSA